jgi:hypothetical protein
MALRAFREVQIEMGHDPAAGQILFPTLSETLDGLTCMPPDALLFGIAGDGLPLLLHLRDPRPGPILVMGERGCGKTDFLKVLMLAAGRFSEPAEARFAVLSDHISDFDDLYGSGNLLGAWPAYDAACSDVLFQLASQVQGGGLNQPLLLLIDGLESVLQMEREAQENLAYILSYGPQSLVWPVVTVNSELALKLSGWLEYFCTRIYGRIANPRTAETLTPQPGAPLNSLFPGSQFCLRQNTNWLKFWLPSLPA